MKNINMIAVLHSVKTFRIRSYFLWSLLKLVYSISSKVVCLDNQTQFIDF